MRSSPATLPSTVALVSHGFALAVLYVHYMGYPLESVWDYIPENDQWRVLEVR